MHEKLQQNLKKYTATQLTRKHAAVLASSGIVKVGPERLQQNQKILSKILDISKNLVELYRRCFS